MTDIVDALIIGGGPAGLGAALALCRQNHTALVFDSGEHRNQYATEMHMVSTWDHRKPAEYRAAARAELKARYGNQCSFADEEVVSINKVEDRGRSGSHFEVKAASDQVRKGRKVILATGSRDILPCIDGFEECWGTGVVHCLLCHGHEESGAASVGVLALDAFAEPSTLLRVLRSCKQFAERVQIYTHGNMRAAASLREVTALVPGSNINAAEIESLEMVGVEGQLQAKDIQVTLEGGKQQRNAFLVYHTATEQASELPEQLGVNVDAEGDIQLGAFQETSVSGVFAAGDCASHHKYVSIAASMGAMAGAGAAQQLQADM